MRIMLIHPAIFLIWIRCSGHRHNHYKRLSGHIACFDNNQWTVGRRKGYVDNEYSLFLAPEKRECLVCQLLRWEVHSGNGG